MSKKILFLFFLFCFFWASPQEKNTLQHAYQKGAEFLYSNRDSTYFYFEKALKLADEHAKMKYLLASYLYLLKANSVHYDLKNYRKNLEKIAAIFECDDRWNAVQNKKSYLDFYLFYKGEFHYKLEEYEKAEECFWKLYDELKKIPADSLTHGNLKSMYAIQAWLGNIYFDNHKYSLAKKYYHKNLDLIRGSSPEIFQKSDLALVNLNLANVFEKEKNFEQAETLIQKSLGFYKSVQGNSRYRNSLISAHQLLANNYLKQKLPAKSLAVIEKMEESGLLGEENLRYLSTFTKYKARAFTQQENFETALRTYRKTLKILQAYYQTAQHADIAEIYSEMAQVFAGQKEFEKSFFHFQKALSALSQGFETTDFHKNPQPEKVLSKLKLVQILSEKQKSLAAAYAHEKNLEYLKIANKTAKILVKTLDALKPEFESKVDMQFLLEETYPAFYQMMETAFLLYENTAQQTYLEDAFYYSEKSRAVQLLLAVQNTNAHHFAGVPDSILQQEQQFRATINHLEKNRFKNPNDQSLKSELFDLKNEFYSFLNTVEKKYPKYHRLKYKTEVTNLPEIKKLLRPEEAILDYYLTENHLYYFVIGNEKTRFERVPFAENSAENIVRLQKHFSNPQVTKIKELQTLSDEVHQKLIPEIDASISSLIILRSGILNYLPFEALYHKENQNYLVENFTISYANSATLYREYAKQKENTSSKILAFAPGFSEEKIPKETRAGLGPLLYNKKEVQLISAYFEGKTFLDEKASLNAFKTNAKNFKILHLATHAIVNDEFPDYSYLAFAPKKDSLTNLLYIKDLYGYDLNADLVVLSACETGIGKLQKGAGMLSLAKGFNYAGAASLVTTQWKIDDKSTSVIMNDFYRNLADGQAKNTALRNAKLEYLKTINDAMLRHPYYWAGFVLSGNTAPVVENSFWSLQLSGGILGLLLLVTGFIYWRKRKKRFF